ncbi:hypothetical protein MPH_05653 [Macrophomina phaseolina MS6]|uniref:Uncharacterized protein n=1 Tax=Macrophomina phaseolina (strain MS6) TaxID=1126212 RepID=K2R435_MACPH|nr:hypothetical protein MPH_05653 [Macrophomina phaseolina MS6]
MSFAFEASSPLKDMQLCDKTDLLESHKIIIKWKETESGPEQKIHGVPKDMIIKFSPSASRMWARVSNPKDRKNYEFYLGVRTDIEVNAVKYVLDQMLTACETRELYFLQLYPRHSYAALKALGITCVRSAWRHELVRWMRVAIITFDDFVAVCELLGTDSEPDLVRHVLHQVVWVNLTHPLGHPDMVQIEEYIDDKPNISRIKREIEAELRRVVAHREAKRLEREQRRAMGPLRAPEPEPYASRLHRGGEWT